MAASLTAGAASAAPPQTAETLLELETDLLFEGIRRRYGYDFGAYSRESLQRRLQARMKAEGVLTLSALQEAVLHDSACMHRLLRAISVPATALFRDPGLFASIREDVIPLLRTWPWLRIWHAGCASGEEPYSMAILLAEEGLLARTSIYATDVNDELLTRAASGRLTASKLAASRQAHHDAGGARPLDEHLIVDGTGARLRPELLERITWAQHDLVSDTGFNDFHLIICANVLIYFTPPFRERIHRLLYESLVPFGFLGLGERELIAAHPPTPRYRPVPQANRLYKKVA
ncbi:MAG: protein-glutamate O-methyltransferase CheR [Chloroflexi bacterium]|nr:MAG: protein-glutamate O-methyltransferase CheR [Chloroflexota bacterium]